MLITDRGMSNSKLCPNCGKKMIKVGTGIVLTSYPPQYPQTWWCGCGHEEPAETLTEKTEYHLNLEEWNKINREKEDDFTKD